MLVRKAYLDGFRARDFVEKSPANALADAGDPHAGRRVQYRSAKLLAPKGPRDYKRPIAQYSGDGVSRTGSPFSDQPIAEVALRVPLSG